MSVNGQYPNNPDRRFHPKKIDQSMQVPLVCPGIEIPGAERKPCGGNIFAQEPVVMYTRHRLKHDDRRFDAPMQVGMRYRCIGCGHYLATADYNAPMDGPSLSITE